MPVTSAASAVRRRNAIGLATSAICHALLFGLGALVLTRPTGNPAAAENVEVDLVEAKPIPIRDVPPASSDKQPTSTVPVVPKFLRAHFHRKSAPRPRAPEVTVSPPTEVAAADDVAIPAAMEPTPRKLEAVPMSGAPPAPTTPFPAAPRPITILATPRYRSNPRPDYPVLSKRRHEEGEVRLTVTVSPQGRPLHVSLAKSSGHSLLDQAAIAAVRTWTFEPARASGIAVTSEVVVPVRFSLSQE